jgi:hypothetical protein
LCPAQKRKRDKILEYGADLQVELKVPDWEEYGKGADVKDPE